MNTNIVTDILQFWSEHVNEVKLWINYLMLIYKKDCFASDVINYYEYFKKLVNIIFILDYGKQDTPLGTQLMPLADMLVNKLQCWTSDQPSQHKDMYMNMLCFVSGLQEIAPHVLKSLITSLQTFTIYLNKFQRKQLNASETEIVLALIEVTIAINRKLPINRNCRVEDNLSVQVILDQLKLYTKCKAVHKQLEECSQYFQDQYNCCSLYQ